MHRSRKIILVALISLAVGVVYLTFRSLKHDPVLAGNSFSRPMAQAADLGTVFQRRTAAKASTPVPDGVNRRESIGKSQHRSEDAQTSFASPSIVTSPPPSPLAVVKPAVEWTADDVLEAMRKKYAEISSLTARGRLTKRWHEKSLVYVDVPFRIYFRRPMSFRFEWMGDRDPYRHSIWSNRQGFFDLAEKTGLRRFSDLRSLCPPHNVSGDPLSLVLRLLVPGSLPKSANLIENASRMEDQVADGVTCYHLAGSVSPSVSVWSREVWIGIDDLLLRQVLTVSNTAYSIGADPRYFSGTETIIESYLDVAADITLPDELFLPIGTKP